MYKAGGADKKAAVNELMETVKTALKSLTVEVPDFQTLKVISVRHKQVGIY
jgi:hypothetical protein